MYVKLLVEQKKKEKEQIEKSGKDNQGTGPGPYRPEGVPESSGPPKPSSPSSGDFPDPNPDSPQPSGQQDSSPLSSEDAKKFRRKLKQMKEET